MLILASGSPRRAKILKKLGVQFRVVKTDAEEVAIEPERTYDAEETGSIVEQNACLKVWAGFKAAGGSSGGILAADTVVWFRNRILGKPKDLSEAAEYLRMMSDKVHSVFTGVAYLPPDATEDDEQRFAIVESKVKFRKLSDAMIDEYVARVKPTDGAGAYDIDESGDLIVESYTGSYENIMGLPVEPLREWKLVV